MRCSLLARFVAVVGVGLYAADAAAIPIYSIDIDTTNGGTSIATEPGWTSLDVTAGNGASVTVDGIAFSVSSIDGSLNRTGPNDLTRDFVYDDGSGQASVFGFGTYGDLIAGTWQVEMWSWDDTLGTTGIGPQRAYWRDITTTATTEHAVALVDVHPTDPVIKFYFESDGIRKYDVFLREANSQDRTRLNAVRLTYIPEPSTLAMLLGLGCIGLLACLRRRRRN